ncbi:MAG: DUF99 family protein [Thermoprotei archaeon]|nr:DUF99 family protein [Thermoprotei archaeon]
MLKPGNILGVEDGSFIPRISRYCILAGVLMHGLCIRDVFLDYVTVDGMDVTDKVIEFTRRARSLQLVITGGITFAGFNVLDPIRVNEECQVPVIIISRRKPDNEAVYRALRRHFRDWKKRWGIIERIGEAMEVINIKSSKFYIELVGMRYEDALEVLEALTIWGKRPEPLRVANLIAKGLSRNLVEV